jgi:DNA-binding Xre family transcriptional regulator
MKWNLRMVAAQRDLWRPTEVLAAFQQVGFSPSLSKVAAMWSGAPVTVRLDDLDKICAALDCRVGDLLQAEPLAGSGSAEEGVSGQEAASAGGPAGGAARPVPHRTRSGPRSLPPN